MLPFQRAWDTLLPRSYLFLYGPGSDFLRWEMIFTPSADFHVFSSFGLPITQDEKIINFSLSTRNFPSSTEKDPQEMSIVRKHNKTGRE